MKVFETEVLGTLTKAQFSNFKRNLEKELGTPKRVKRLSIQVTDTVRRNVDTRIRITNGEAEIMQKLGDWNAQTREEVSVTVPSIPEIIFGHWLILNSILDQPTTLKSIIQTGSYLFITPEYEIKLTHQFGKEDVYNFEVESFNQNVDVLKICESFNLQPDLKQKDAAYWDSFNRRVNLDIRDIEADVLLDIISDYCLASSHSTS